jgi:hypothetical protein
MNRATSLYLAVAFFDFAHYPVVMSDNDATRFRKQAEECREQAAKAVNPLDKESWLRVAAEWIKLAQATDERRGKQ